MMNIMTRTHNRPDYFRVCKERIEMQTYKDINHIVCSDVPCSYYPAIPVVMPLSIQNIPYGHYYAPHNAYMVELQKHCKNGYCMTIDDDDCFMDTNSLQTIVDHIVDEDQLLIWKVMIAPNFVVPSHSFGKTVTACDISGIGFAYHSKHNPIDWGIISMGDYRAAKELENRRLKITWIDKILTRTQSGAHNGL